MELKNCTLEWDQPRGVLYVHNNDTGASVLRICGLSKDPKDHSRLLPGDLLDIWLSKSPSWNPCLSSIKKSSKQV